MDALGNQKEHFRDASKPKTLDKIKWLQLRSQIHLRIPKMGLGAQGITNTEIVK